MQDDTQRHERAAAPPSGSPPPQPQPLPISPTGPAPATSPPASTVTPRGLEELRSESSTEPRGFGTLGFAPPERNDPLPFHTDLDSPLSYGYEHQEPMYLPLALSVGAGFKFGCGFMLAVGVSLFGLFLAASVIFFVAALAGVPIPGATP